MSLGVEASVRFVPAEIDGFPTPSADRMGLASDQFDISVRSADEGAQYTLVHRRPFVGGSMHLFLETVAPTVNEHQIRKHVASNFLFRAEDPEGRRDEPGQSFVDEQIGFHTRKGRLGRSAIGDTFTAYQREVMFPWVEALKEERLDPLYAPLSRLYAYSDFDARVAVALDDWRNVPKHDYGNGRIFYDRRGSKIEEVLTRYGETPITDEYDVNDRTYKGWELKFKLLMEHIVMLPADEVRNTVGMAISDHYYNGLHHFGGHHMVVDIARQEYWYDRMRKYQPERGMPIENWDYLFEMPDVEFGDSALRLTDSEGGFVEVSFGEPEKIYDESPWEMTTRSTPDWAWEEGLFPVVSWVRSNDGERKFVDYAGTKSAVEALGFEAPDSADSYLGKLLIKSFGQTGEYLESVKDMKWLDRMGLAGRPRKQPMQVRELPVYIQLPQHQDDLLGSQFLAALESLVA